MIYFSSSCKEHKTHLDNHVNSSVRKVFEEGLSTEIHSANAQQLHANGQADSYEVNRDNAF